jgi:hypothetical protein
MYAQHVEYHITYYRTDAIGHTRPTASLCKLHAHAIMSESHLFRKYLLHVYEHLGFIPLRTAQPILVPRNLPTRNLKF